MPNVGRPDVDTLRNLSAAILVDQERMGANSRSTVGTATDAYSMLRLIYSRIGKPHVGHSGLFSFNDPRGMCPGCEGMGRISTVDVDAMVDRSLSLNAGAITLPNFGVNSWGWRMFAESGYFDADKKLADYSEAEWEQFLRGPEARIEVKGLNLKYEGLIHRFERSFLSKDVETAQPHIRAAIERVATFAVCPDCGGARLNQAALGAKIGGHNIAECAAMQVDDLTQLLAGIDAPSVAPALEALRGTLDSLVEVGLGYLSLDRESATLSGGEAQRVKMVRHLGSSLSSISAVRLTRALRLSIPVNGSRTAAPRCSTSESRSTVATVWIATKATSSRLSASGSRSGSQDRLPGRRRRPASRRRACPTRRPVGETPGEACDGPADQRHRRRQQAVGQRECEHDQRLGAHQRREDPQLRAGEPGRRALDHAEQHQARRRRDQPEARGHEGQRRGDQDHERHEDHPVDAQQGGCAGPGSARSNPSRQIQEARGSGAGRMSFSHRPRRAQSWIHTRAKGREAGVAGQGLPSVVARPVGLAVRGRAEDVEAAVQVDVDLASRR